MDSRQGWGRAVRYDSNNKSHPTLKPCITGRRTSLFGRAIPAPPVWYIAGWPMIAIMIGAPSNSHTDLHTSGVYWIQYTPEVWSMRVWRMRNFWNQTQYGATFPSWRMYLALSLFSARNSCYWSLCRSGICQISITWLTTKMFLIP